ncbi:MAG TPA: hypothetical protein VGT01_02690 [Candidatus Dormibacteraeota bacterium]|nr:hypothetical protein [Candidatus Dormibacteraeota bacterium]
MGIAFLVAGCAATRGELPPTGNADKLYAAVSSHNSYGVSVIDARSHATERRLPLGVPTNDWRHLYSIAGTSLVDTDPLTGATLDTIALPGSYQLPAATINGMPGGMSPDGHWLVVESYDGASHFLVVDTQASKVLRTISLAGHFHFDAVSNDGMRLYLIQYLNGKEYYVRLYNVDSGTLDENIVVDKSDGNQAMNGLRLSGVATPGGNWLFSMYVRENDNPFIHALSLDGPFAFCLDLPGGGWASNEAEMHWSIAMNREGSRVLAVNGATGIVAEVDISQQFNPQVTRTVHIGGGRTAKAGGNTAVVTADGRWLVTAGSSGLMWIDTSNLTVRKQALTDWQVWSIALSPDGRAIYAVSDTGGIAQVSMAAGTVDSRFFNSGEGQPLALMRVASA